MKMMKYQRFLNYKSLKVKTGNKEVKRKIFVIIIQTLRGNKEICSEEEVLSIQPFRSKDFPSFKRENKILESQQI